MSQKLCQKKIQKKIDTNNFNVPKWALKKITIIFREVTANFQYL